VKFTLPDVTSTVYLPLIMMTPVAKADVLMKGRVLTQWNDSVVNVVVHTNCTTNTSTTGVDGAWSILAKED
jgi:hypothetical protein